MNYSKYFVIVATTFLVLFARHSNAGFIDIFTEGADILKSIGTITADTVGGGVSILFETIENQFLEGGLHRNAEKALETVKKQSSDVRTISTNNEAIDIVLSGLIETINEVAASGEATYGIIKTLRESKTATDEEVRRILEEAFETVNKQIGSAGIKLYLALGAATEICEEGASQGLNDAIQIMTNAGTVSRNGLNASRSLAIQGVGAGNETIDPALLIALKGVRSTLEATYSIITTAGKKAFEAIINEAIPLEEALEDETVKKDTATENPQYQNAIHIIQQSANQTIELLVSGPEIKAIKVIRDGLVSACKTIALATQHGHKAIDEAKKIPSQESALATVQKGISASQKECTAAISSGYQALGAAAHLFGPKSEKSLIEAIKALEIAGVQLTNGLANSLILATQGITANATENGLTAAYDGVALTSLSGYAEIKKCAEIAFQGFLTT